MSTLRHQANAMASVEAETFAPVLRFPRVEVKASPLNPSLWPPCPRCKLDVNECECLL